MVAARGPPRWIGGHHGSGPVPTGTLPHPTGRATDPVGMTANIRRIGALATLTFALISGAMIAAAPAGAATAADLSYEAKVVSLTNDARAKNGCTVKLRADAKLTTAARAHSQDMVTRNFFSHTGSNGSTFVVRLSGAGYTVGASGENIAWGYRTPETVVTGWMNSAPHKANIMNCKSKAVGVGMARKADGTPYWTQDFGTL
jgi:uncharacterized protein YkwD